jgi:CheY-like chemotaxis protein
VDDRLPSLEVRRALLTALGYDVLIASDPESALAIADKVNVDLVVLDYSFPGHISGEDLANQLRTSRPGVPLVMLSGFPDLPASARESVDCVITKGTDKPSDLLATIARLLKCPERDPGPMSLLERSQQLMDRSKELIQHSRDQAPPEKASR